MADRRATVAIVSSVGGHLTEIVDLMPALSRHRLLWILNDDSPVLPDGIHPWRIAHGERDWRVLWNVVELAAIFAREKPDLVLSTGASPAVTAAVITAIAGIPFVYIEGWAAVTRPTLTGNIMRWLTPHRFARWPDVARRLGAEHAGAPF